MYALVLDNTFAKQFSKTATFILLTYPTSSPPQSNHQTHHIQGSTNSSTLNLKDNSGQIVNDEREPTGVEGRPSALALNRLHSAESGVKRPGSSSKNIITSPSLQTGGDSVASEPKSNFFTGFLQKRRRKRHQGYARRFFSLDVTTCTLSYYHNRNTMALRGAIPLSLAVICTYPNLKQISIDSGAEVWHLKASNSKDFEAWVNALENATATSTPTSHTPAVIRQTHIRRQPTTRFDQGARHDNARLKDLLQRLEMSRDSALSIAKDTDPKYRSLRLLRMERDKGEPHHASETSSAADSPMETPPIDTERRPFWKRRTGSERTVPGAFKRSVSAQPSSSSSTINLNVPNRSIVNLQGASPETVEEDTLHNHCMSLLTNLDVLARDFSKLLEDGKLQRSKSETLEASRHSLDTVGSQEFFDAEAGSQFLSVHQDSDDDVGAKMEDVPEGDSTSESDVDGASRRNRRSSTPTHAQVGYPTKVLNLDPLPIGRIHRRDHITPPLVQPPSLIGFLRKNVGKDFSTISMPVSANEPLSLLQRAAEQLEYSTLLDEAAKSQDATRRLAYVTAFAISALSVARSKERAIRKPFNPMLGETYELVREDRGFRFIAEKVCHRPVRMACQAESKDWAFTQSPMPTQKFWGKSAELITEGRVRVVLHDHGDRFSWAPPTSFLRNIIAGEKYVEPVGSMTIVNESNGEQAVATFKAKGMFSGRSEDVSVQLLDSYGDELSLGLAGKWTSFLVLTSPGSNPDRETPPIWTVSDKQHDIMLKGYGMTTFASSLNELTLIERGRLPPTDSRLRPDQRSLEQGDLDGAEHLKVKLEEAQRRRRRELEENGRDWAPKWFEKVIGDGLEEIWQLKRDEGYWNVRAKGGDWGNVEEVFPIQH